MFAVLFAQFRPDRFLPGAIVGAVIGAGCYLAYKGIRFFLSGLNDYRNQDRDRPY
ncbi:MAG: hypothetical protein L0Y71_22530 [Gemmataceae bacterium]|nr:hypothetical protein [Gemmataceae bacterium]